MSGYLDADVVLRYLTDDPPELARRAAVIIDVDDERWLTDGTIAEVAYVLTRVYGVSRPEVVDALTGFVQRANIRLHAMEKGTVVRALAFCRPSGRVSFADALLWACAQSSGIRQVYTFDARFPATQPGHPGTPENDIS